METEKTYERRNEDGEWVSENSAALVEPIVIAGDESGIVVDMTDDSGPLSEVDSDGLVGSRRLEIVNNVLIERQKQDEKWGPVPRLDHDFGKWLKILMEEIGEACAAELEVDFYEGEIQPEFIQAVDHELTQAGAVLVAWLEHRAAIREEQRR